MNSEQNRTDTDTNKTKQKNFGHITGNSSVNFC